MVDKQIVMIQKVAFILSDYLFITVQISKTIDGAAHDFVSRITSRMQSFTMKLYDCFLKLLITHKAIQETKINLAVLLDETPQLFLFTNSTRLTCVQKKLFSCLCT